jgi:hypothetical protein
MYNADRRSLGITFEQFLFYRTLSTAGIFDAVEERYSSAPIAAMQCWQQFILLLAKPSCLK